MDDATKAAKRAAAIIKKRDKVFAQLQVIDSELKQVTMDYSRAMRIWGFTPLMMRKVCASRDMLT